MQCYRHIQLNCREDEHILKRGEKWTWLEKNIQGAAGRETLRGAGGVSSSWESTEGEDVERRKTSKSQAEEI